MTIRWKRWAIGAASAVGVYAVTGFWLVPGIIKSQFPKYAETELERKASIGQLHFNPFTLRLEAQDIRLTEVDGAPLFAVGGLTVEMQWRSLFRRAWSFAEIRVTAPAVQLAIAKDGTFNIAAFLATLDKHKKDDKDTGMPRLIISHFALDDGKVAMHDKHAGYEDTFTPISFALNNLSTLPDENGDYTLSADAGLGGKLRWKGVAAVNPVSGSGALTLENVVLPGLAAYLKSFSRIVVVDGKLSARLPYRFAYQDGKLDAHLEGAGLTLNQLALKRGDAAASFVELKQLAVTEVGVDLLKRSVQIGGLQLNGGALAVRRDARGDIDVAGLMLPAPVAKPSPAPVKPAGQEKESNWKLHFKQIGLDAVALSYIDETVSPALKVSSDNARLKLGLLLDGGKLNIDDAAFSMENVAMNAGAVAPLKLSRIGFEEAALDLAVHKASVGRLYADGGQLDLSRDAKGQFVLMGALPKAGSAAPASAAAPAEAGPAWTANVKSVELNKFGARYDDASTGIKVNLQDFNLKLRDAGTELKKPLAFEGAVALREGGQLTAKGKVVPATGAVDTDLKLSKLALAPVQPLLGKYVKLKIADGAINAAGRLRTGAGGSKADPALRYDGSFEVAELSLNEQNNDRFAHWKSVRAEKVALSLKPDLLDVAELRVVEPNAILMIENDRSLNAQRLLVQQPAAPAEKAAPAPAGEPFPVRMRRVRFQNAKLDFTDLSLRPQFGARIYELNGVITGLSSKRDARAQIELDGRVDDYGLARVRGQLNPFVPADNTDMNVVFKNVDMVSASPYSMKFAGYKIAEGKISLDLQYKVRNGQLEGNNQVVLDKLTLGERIDSPDALKLPLELALAILKDSNGRIDLGIPVSGNMNDPSFSYGAVVWKALGNIMTKVVTAPFRALGNLFGVSGDKLEAVEFDAGSAVVLPPEREKLQQVARILVQKPELKLSVPGLYNQDNDGAALRAQALRRVVLAKADIKLAADEQPGPLDIGQRKVRSALRDLYAERFGAPELDKQKKAAESAAGTGDEAAKKLPVLQRLGKLVQGEPQVADASAFYDGLQARLEKNQALPKDALPQLGAMRAAAVIAVLKQSGVNPATASASAPVTTESRAGQPIAVKLALSAK
ncbi:Uncharacterized protein involved in outer membrane biogenesis [Duganella sacchari]|uniref:Uncharacterized protein involved in outer membrane biogenesis n=1 Tax=Duganella sacchari TaxID=551987 RepID=A0A1M7QHS6_9BURK|nr:DUF748 domain-containing protein [Duganella sacchari]SHN30601.1 Uncharacterized protein involved in outer membrane biogenesis [Duganella sacchari]